MTTITPHPISEAAGADATAPKALLLAAPLLMAVARALLVPFDDEDWDATMTSMAEHQGRSDAGWLLAIVACGLLAVTAVALANRLRGAGKARTATFVTITTAVGWAATAAICLGGLYLSVAAGAPDRAAQVALQEDFNEGASGFVFLMTAVAAVGYITLAVSLARSHLVTKGAAALLAVGGVATLLTMAGPITALLVTAALLLTAGHALAARVDADSV